jgi:hypothetical protein
MELKRAALIMAVSVVATYAVCSFLLREPAKPAVGTKPSPTPATERRLDADWDGPEHLLFAAVRGNTLMLIRKELQSGAERMLWEGPEPERVWIDPRDSLAATPWGALLRPFVGTAVLFTRGAGEPVQPTKLRIEYGSCMDAAAYIVWLAPEYITATYFPGPRKDGEDCPESPADAGGLGLLRKQPNGSWQVVWRKLLKKGYPGPAAFCRCADGIYLAQFDEIWELSVDEEEHVAEFSGMQHNENLWWWRLGRDKLHLVRKARLPLILRFAEVLAIDCERAYFKGTAAEANEEVVVLASLSRTTGRYRVHARVLPPEPLNLTYKLKISPDFRNLLILVYARDERVVRLRLEDRLREWYLERYFVVPFSFSGEVRGRVIDVLSGQVR